MFKLEIDPVSVRKDFLLKSDGTAEINLPKEARTLYRLSPYLTNDRYMKELESLINEATQIYPDCENHEQIWSMIKNAAIFVSSYMQCYIPEEEELERQLSALSAKGIRYV